MKSPVFRTAILLLAFAAIATSCKREKWPCLKGKGSIETETRNVDAYRNVEIDIAANLFLTQDPTLEGHTIVIEAENNLMEHIETIVRGNTLEIYSERCFNRHDPINIYLTFKDLDEVQLDGSGDIVSQNTLITDNLRFALNGSGNIDVAAEVSTLKTDLDGSGDIKYSGTANQSTITIDGSGNIRAYALTATRCSISINGSGDCRVTATDQLDVDINGSGNVYYRGTPTTTINIDGSGDVRADN